MMQVVEEKVELIKEESPWKEEIEQLSNKNINFLNICKQKNKPKQMFKTFKTLKKLKSFRFGPIDFQKLFLLLTGFRNIPEEKWV